MAVTVAIALVLYIFIMSLVAFHVIYKPISWYYRRRKQGVGWKYVFSYHYPNSDYVIVLVIATLLTHLYISAMIAS